jgi:MerR family transcriptional regulator, heat shock protein HspR
MAEDRTLHERALYIISVAAELAGVHAQTLRIYERKGLIEPQRTQGGSRRYSEHDIALLRRIQELTNEGVSLVGVRKILELEDELGKATARIRELERALEQARQDLADAVERAHAEHRRELVPLSGSLVRYRDR